ncbi:hypothetical protein BUE80_DR005828, partial [Diplocarpon rosae]
HIRSTIRDSVTAAVRESSSPPVQHHSPASENPPQPIPQASDPDWLPCITGVLHRTALASQPASQPAIHPPNSARSHNQTKILFLSLCLRLRTADANSIPGTRAEPSCVRPN